MSALGDLPWACLTFYPWLSTHSFFDRYNPLSDYSYGAPVQEMNTSQCFILDIKSLLHRAAQE